jgi:thioesterase domain-containing protein
MSSLGRTQTTYDDIFESPRIASRDASIMRACFEAFGKYTSDRSTATLSHQAKYSGPLQVFRTRTQSLLSGAQADLGWSRWVESVSIHVLPGNHEMVFSTPSVVALAEEIARGIKRLEDPTEHLRRT